MIISNCNRCGKELTNETGLNRVTCKHIIFWEHDTERYLCNKCYQKFKTYMKKCYNDFFTYLKEKENR